MEVSNGYGSTESIYINYIQLIPRCRLKNPSVRSSKCRTQEKFGTLDYRTLTGKRSIARARLFRSLACKTVTTLKIAHRKMFWSIAKRKSLAFCRGSRSEEAAD